MTQKDLILKLAKKKGQVATSDVVQTLNVSRVYAARLCRQLTEAGRLVRVGRTRGAYYVLLEKIELVEPHFKRRLKNADLEEDQILESVYEKIPSLLKLSQNTRRIFDYTFSEMLNNAIEHSHSKYIEVTVGLKGRNLECSIRDFGVGVFKSIKRKYRLASEIESIQELLKGKATTAPKAHSGEGIFFTSKAADTFSLDSFDYRLLVDNTLNDVFVEKLTTPFRGTLVTLTMALRTHKRLADIFQRYQTGKEEFSFDKTEVQVKLYTLGMRYVSRSEARRVLARLEKFRRVILDFDQVATIGQAFADEIFRVYKNQRPEVEILSTHANEAVQFMINRVKKH